MTTSPPAKRPARVHGASAGSRRRTRAKAGTNTAAATATRTTGARPRCHAPAIAGAGTSRASIGGAMAALILSCPRLDARGLAGQCRVGLPVAPLLILVQEPQERHRDGGEEHRRLLGRHPHAAEVLAAGRGDGPK